MTWFLTIGAASISFFIFIAIYTIINLAVTIRIIKLFLFMISGKPALILTKDSLIDNYSKITIDWNDISGIAMRGGKSNYISIKLYESEKYIPKITNPLTRWTYRLNSKLFFGTFTIGVGLMKGNNWEILKTLNKFKMENKAPVPDSKLHTV